ncbi:winged helix DNA-binding domain-containing protein [Paenibacillus sp. N1-5-1-14]|uniref:winged helix DNA-binding domain-containing protein n=1 Tax=Paenibacillus radicibacter TaxID=2972488 RepID=UPI0021594150|nr:winged helix DNA-binding domain-containing protein [Paenibacillus radicibacter]MCR8645007.1 winged helix DNA-binding domain-containing protein [Paenibacillus radicibacter]
MGQSHQDTNAVLSVRTLNRTLLARQCLLERSEMPVMDAVEHLVGLQSQMPTSPYYGLWTRLKGFRNEDLSMLIQNRQIVRLAMMRSTLHLVTAKDSLALRPVLQSMMDRELKGTFSKRLEGIDLEELSAIGRQYVEVEPRTLNDVGLFLSEKWTDRDPKALASVIRNKVPLVQVPPRGLWGSSGQAMHTSAELWLGDDLARQDDSKEMILRYLRAFGPATVADIQAWSGLNKLRDVVKELKPQLRMFFDEQGRELWDVQDAPIMDSDLPAPLRFIGDFDNILLSYVDRSRIIADAYKPIVFTKNGIVRPTVLLDGFVKGVWNIEREKDSAKLVIEPFEPFSKEDQELLTQEGLQLLQFAAEEAQTFDVQFVD